MNDEFKQPKEVLDVFTDVFNERFEKKFREGLEEILKIPSYLWLNDLILQFLFSKRSFKIFGVDTPTDYFLSFLLDNERYHEFISFYDLGTIGLRMWEHRNFNDLLVFFINNIEQYAPRYCNIWTKDYTRSLPKEKNRLAFFIDLAISSDMYRNDADFAKNLKDVAFYVFRIVLDDFR